jgi:S-adenosylmethionine decarboxylase
MHFGEHFTLDGYEGDKDLLNSKELVLSALSELPALLDMNILYEPQVVYAPNKGEGSKDSGGWSGFVIIAESHISIHTFPLRGFVSIDVYTCKSNMDTIKIENYFKDILHLQDTETHFIKRGMKYPQDDIY